MPKIRRWRWGLHQPTYTFNHVFCWLSTSSKRSFMWLARPWPYRYYWINDLSPISPARIYDSEGGVSAVVVRLVVLLCQKLTPTMASPYAKYHCLKMGEIAEMCRWSYRYLLARLEASVNNTKCVTGNMPETPGVRMQCPAPPTAAFEAIKRIVGVWFSYLSSFFLSYTVI